MISSLPLFPDEIIEISDDLHITRVHLRRYILEHYKDIADQYCIVRTFNNKTGDVDKKYAWHSIMEVLNDNGHSQEIINHFYGFRKKER